MCYWGIALTLGLELQQPDRTPSGSACVRGDPAGARRWPAGATPRERALIEALATRHSSAPAADRAALDRAYADAMRDVSQRFPDDLDAATLFADALMNLRPWNLWTPDGSRSPSTAEIVATLERVLRATPTIRARTTSTSTPSRRRRTRARGEAAADRLGALMPGAGHLVHMPSHIYWRVGRYADAVDVNVARSRPIARTSRSGEPSPIYRDALLPAQHRLHLALREHVGSQRRD